MNLISVRSTLLSPLDLDIMQTDISCIHLKYARTFIAVINQFDAQKFCFTISLFHASTCFEHMSSKHVAAWNKLIVKQKFYASSWLITEINKLRCTVSKTSKYVNTLLTLPIWFLFDVFVPLIDCLTLTRRHRHVFPCDASGSTTSSQDQKQQ